MLDLVFVALLQVASGDPAPPADAPQTQQQTQQQEVDPQDVIRCRRVRHTGSRIASTRVCMSARQEAELREQTAHELREARSRSITGTQENPTPPPR